MRRASAEDLPAACDVAIVGAGPIGLMFANLLGAAGVNAVLLERNDGLVGLPRAIAYDPETLRLFAQVGLLEAIVDELVRDPRVTYLNARGRTLMEIDAPASAIGHSQLGTFYQPSFERALLTGLSRFDAVRVAFAHHVVALDQDGEMVELRIGTPAGPRRLQAKYVVACDGGASPTREAIGARLVGSTYAERWLVVDAKVKNHRIDGITFFCDPRRPTVRLPAVGERVRWEFMQLPGESPEDLSSAATIKRLLAPYVDFSHVEIERRAVYTFHARVADRWRKGRIFLAGDAAHLMPPFAGQGMNGGMKDAANLAWKLAAVLTGQAGPAILETYEIERAPSVRAMVNLSRRLGAVIMPTRPAVAAARDALFALLNLSPRFRSFIRLGGVLPPPRIARSVLTGRRRDPLIGQMLPQPISARPGEPGFFDRRLGCSQWLVLGIGVDPMNEISKCDRATLERLGASFVCVNGAAAEPTLTLQCDDRRFIAWTKRYRLRGALVRPDRFIAERLDPRANLHSLLPFAEPGAAFANRLGAPPSKSEIRFDSLPVQ